MFQRKSIRDNFRGSLMTACERAGITFGMDKSDGFRFHDIRASVKAYMLLAGPDKAVRNAILGHALRGMDACYLRLDHGALKAGMERYTAWLEGRIRAVYASVDQTVEQGD